MKYTILFGSFLAGCALVGVVEAGTSCHGKKKDTTPVSTTVEQSVVVSPGVTVKESVEVDGAPAGNVTVVEEVIVGEGGGVDGPTSVSAVRKAARKAKRATVAESKAERRAGRFERKAGDANAEADAEAAVKRAYTN
jgi:hypothetical protein